jgi:hypothetical protein
VKRNISRFAALHKSDWYLNRAIFHVLLGTLWLGEAEQGTRPRSRGDIYYAHAAAKKLQVWRSLASGVPTIESRKLIPEKVDPRSALASRCPERVTPRRSSNRHAASLTLNASKHSAKG